MMEMVIAVLTILELQVMLEAYDELDDDEDDVRCSDGGRGWSQWWC